MNQEFKKNILIPIAVTASILIVIEMISRMLLAHIYDRHFDSSLIQENKYGSSSGLKPNATGTVWGKAFHTDEMGGRKHSKRKNGKPKLLIIGDSVTEGVGVDDSATFANQYNNSLDGRDDDKDVRNISLIGWSVSDYRNVVDQLAGHDTLIKDICIVYCLNDIYGKAKTSDLPAMANKGLLSRINALLQDSYCTYKLIKLFVYQNSAHYYKYDEAFYKDSTMVSAMMADMIHIKNVCDSNKIKLLILIVPYRSQLSDRTNNLPQRVLVEEFTKNHFKGIDLLTNWRKKSSYSEEFLFADEIHLSSIGHKALLDAIYQK